MRWACCCMGPTPVCMIVTSIFLFWFSTSVLGASVLADREQEEEIPFFANTKPYVAISIVVTVLAALALLVIMLRKDTPLEREREPTYTYVFRSSASQIPDVGTQQE